MASGRKRRAGREEAAAVGSAASADRRRARRIAALKALAVAGVVAACAALAALVGDSDYRATPFGWLPLLVVVAAVVLARAYLAVLRRGLSFEELGGAGSCVRGDDVSFSVRFSNSTPLLFFRIEAYFYISDLFGNKASETMTTLALSPFETYDLEFKARFNHVGAYSAGLDRIVICDFLRLFTATVGNSARRYVQVAPRIQPLDDIDFSDDSVVENARALKAVLADSLDYAYVREYVRGDPIKNIHWKISARTESYMTRLFEVYTNPGVAIVMGFYAEGLPAKEVMELFDAVVECAFSVGAFAQEQGMDAEVLYENAHGEQVMRTSWRPDEMAEIVGELPRMGDDPALRAGAIDVITGQATAQYGQNNVVICTADLSDELVGAVVESKAHRRTPLVIAAVPRSLVDKEREDYAASLLRLDAADIGYVVLSGAEELAGVSGL